MALKFAVFVCFLALISFSSSNHVQDETVQDQGAGSGLNLILKVIESCEKHKDTAKCLKLKALKFVDRAISTDEISVMNGVSMVQSGQVANRSHDEVAYEGRDFGEVLVERVAKFFESHALQVNVSKLTDGSFLQEGRGKKKKMMAPIMLGVMWKAGLIALSLKAIALLAGKALLVANVAMVLAVVLGLKALVGDQHHEKVTYEVVKSPHVSHSYVHSASSPSSSTHGWESSGGHEAGKNGNGNYRSIDTVEPESSNQAFVYHAQIPTHVQHIVVPRPSTTTQILVGARSAE